MVDKIKIICYKILAELIHHEEGEVEKIKQFFKAIKIFLQLGPKQIIKLQEQVIRDPLTGLYNRRFFQETGVAAIEKAKRYGRPLTLVFIDINNFKAINDTLGHLEGDRVLQKVAEVLITHCRKIDLAFRWGGDEFLLLLPETSEEKATKPMKRIAEELRSEKIYISYGVVPWDKSFISNQEFIDEAERRMYVYKLRKGLGRRSRLSPFN